MRVRALIVLGALVLAAAALADDECPSCCCDFGGAGFGANSGPPRSFAYGCYTGDDTNGRLIQTGIQSLFAGLVFVNRKDVTTPFCNRYNSPALVTAGIQGRGQANCTNNEDANLFSGYTSNGFVVNDNTFDPTDSLNNTGQNYCWYEWSTAPNWHGTFTYTGNGISPRAITLSGAGDLATKGLVMIQNRTNGSGPVLDNAFVAKTSDMSTNQSVLWWHAAASASNANMIRGLGTDTVNVGSDLNESGVTYFGAWWNLTDANLAGTKSWTGNGTSGGNNCALPADVQNFSGLNCNPTGLVTMEDFFDEIACAHQECDAIRAFNIDNNIAGPGNITSVTNNYLQNQTTPDDEGIRLTAGLAGFGVNGGATSEVSCNDNTQSYYSAYWCNAAPTTGNTPIPTVTRTFTPTVTRTPTVTNTPTITSTVTPTSSDTSPANWSSSFIAVWEFDESSASTRASTGTCTTDCGLAVNGTVSQDTTNKVIGTASASTATGSNFLSCAASTCDEIKLNAVAGATWGGFARPSLDNSGIILTWTSAQVRWQIQRSTTNNQLQCLAREAGGTLRTASSANNAFDDGAWGFYACTFDDTNNELKTFAEGAFGSATGTTDIGNTTTGNFRAVDAGNSWTGQVDEAFVIDRELTDTDLCRVCSCGVNGALGPCLCAGGGASYSNTGYNTTLCGSCTLPACNKAGPS